MAKTPVSSPSRAKPSASGKRIQVRRSGVHGKGVFALQDIAEGETLIEYVGEIISWDEAQDRHPHDPSDPNHTFYFHVNEDRVIDALYGGNSSRWINHSCDPNCEADEDNDRIFIKAIRNKGLMMAVEFESFEVLKPIIDKAIENGVITDWFLFCDDDQAVAVLFIKRIECV